MQQGLTARKGTGAELAQPYFLALQAEVYGKLRQREQALPLLSKALATRSAGGQQRQEAELYRLKGELTLQGGTRDWGLETSSPFSQAPSLKPQVSRAVAQEAEECFLKAIAIAQKQQAKSLELRATTSLARLWQSQGKTAEARQILAEIYGWFTEGFDTKDLLEAKSLLDELAEDR